MKKRCGADSIRCLLLMGVVLFFLYCALTMTAQANHASKAKEGSMSLAYKTESPAIPPIDAAAPSIYETASFGLG